MMFRSLLAAAFALGLSGAALADTTPVDCSTFDGQQLCRSIRLMQSYIVSCEGDCYSLFAQQERAFGDIADTYYGQINADAVIGADLGGLAQTAAYKLCNYSYENVDANVITGIMIQANRALEALKALQIGAGILAPTSCTFTES